MALMTATVSCARPWDSVFQCVGCTSCSRMLDLTGEENRVPRHVKPPHCGEASKGGGWVILQQELRVWNITRFENMKNAKPGAKVTCKPRRCDTLLWGFQKFFLANSRTENMATYSPPLSSAGCGSNVILSARN